MKYNPQCMTDVINCIIANLEFSNKELNGLFDCIYINFSSIFSNSDLQNKYSLIDIKLCLAILSNKKLIETKRMPNDEYVIKEITTKGYDEFFKLPN